MDNIKSQLINALEEICTIANLKKGDVFVIGCSSSEISGGTIGRASNEEIGQIIFDTANQFLSNKGIALAAQCCEHLNRALVIESTNAGSFEIVNVVPKVKAGGSFATAAFKGFENPVVIESVSAKAGLDIGLTMIGMHIKSVAVPVHLNNNKIGEATVFGAYSRPKYIGGPRAQYE